MVRAAAGRFGAVGRSYRLRRRAALICCGLTLVAAGAFVWISLDSRRAARDEGIRLALAGDLAAAEPLLADALVRDPADADALRALALGRIAAGRLSEATEPLERWRAVRPDDPEPHLTRIDQAVKLSRMAEAIDPARAVLALRPESEALREQLTYWLYLTGRTEEADTECSQCRRRHDSPLLKLLHAEIAYRLGDNSRAERLADELLATGSRTPAALTLRAAIHLDACNPAAAVPLLREVVARGAEGQSRARHYLSLALARTGDEEGAKKLLADEQRQQAVGLWEKYGRSDSIGYKVAIAEALMATGKTDEAVRLLEQALAHDSNCRAAHKLLADHYLQRGLQAKAAEHRLKASD